MNSSTEKQYLSNVNKEHMSLIKEENEKTEDYILQKDATTKSTTTLIVVVLVILITGVIISGFYFEWF